MLTDANSDVQSIPAYLVYKENAVLSADKAKKKKNKRKQNVSQEVVSRFVKKQKLNSSIEQGNVTTEALHARTVKKGSVYRENKNQKRNKVKTSIILCTNSKASHKQKHGGKRFRQNTIKQGVSQFIPSDNPLKDSHELLKWLISPLEPNIFFSMYWEQQVLHIKRSNKSYYTHIFNSWTLDTILRNHHLCYTKNIDVVSYEQGVKEVFNQEGRATPSALWDYYSNGCSIRLLNPQTYNHKVQLLLATLQEYFGTMVGANVYLTPPGSQGFAPHYDDIEAFILQLEGRKHWKLYHSRDDGVLARYSSPNLKNEDIGDPFMELTLNAGEMLYFPRGTIHEGRTDADSHSLHITVSVYQQTSFADLLQNILPNALKKAAENDIQFRKGLPLDFLKQFGVATSSQNEDFRNSVRSKVESLIHSLVQYIDIDTSADMLGRKFMYDSMPPILTKDEAKRSWKADGPYLSDGKVINKIEIRLDTKIRLLRYYCIRLLIEDNSNPKLYYNTENATVYHGEEEQWLELEFSMVPAIQMLQNEYPCYIEVEKLPMEVEPLKLQFVAELWELGLIVTERSLDLVDDE